MDKKKFSLVTVIVLLSLAVLSFGKLDYKISTALVNENSIWANFFNLFGEEPFTLGLLIVTGVLYGARKKGSRFKEIIYAAISYPIMFLMSFLSVMQPFRYYYEFKGGIPEKLNLYILLLSVILFSLSVFIMHKMNRDKLKKYRKVAIIMGILIFVEVLCVNMLKILWARPRMRSIDNFNEFRYWWQINGPLNHEEFKSFPSGHTANALVLIAYSGFILNNEKLKKRFITFSLFFGAFTALSRVVLGAHFLSDVLVSGYIVIVLYYFIHDVVNKRKST